MKNTDTREAVEGTEVMRGSVVVGVVVYAERGTVAVETAPSPSARPRNWYTVKEFAESGLHFASPDEQSSRGAA
jgi:hypothetical protein